MSGEGAGPRVWCGLTELDIAQCAQLTDADIALALSPVATSAATGAAALFGAGGGVHARTSIMALESLDVSGCSGVAAATMAALGRHCLHLRLHVEGGAAQRVRRHKRVRRS